MVSSVTEKLRVLTDPIKDLQTLSDKFTSTYKDLAINSDNQFLATPLTFLPSGLESGQYLAIDLGGSNLRIAVVTLRGSDWKGKQDGHKVVVDMMEAWTVPEDVKAGWVEGLFEWIVKCMDTVLPSWSGGPLKATVTWSFPQNQVSNAESHIMPSGKGYSMKSQVSETNIGKLLSTAYNKARVTDPKLPPIEVIFITNDSISTLLSAAYLTHNPHLRGEGGPDSRVLMGEILGTGSNATVIFPTDKLAAWKSKHLPEGTTHSLLNTEWSIYGIRPALESVWTDVDTQLNKESSNPDFQPFEHLCSGRYLGEIVRLFALKVLDPNDPVRQSKVLNTAYEFETRFASELEAVETPQGRVEYLEKALGVKVSQKTAEEILEICVAVSTRAAALVACATIGLLKAGETGVGEDNGEEVGVAYTGTVLEMYPKFLSRVEEFTRSVVGGVQFIPSWEGGIVGAAVGGGMVDAAAQKK